MANITWEQVAVLTGAPRNFSGGVTIIGLAEGFLDPRLQGEDADRGLLLLAAHLWATLEPRVASESIGGLSIQYAMPALGDGLKSTPWGLQYCALVKQKRDLPMVVL